MEGRRHNHEYLSKPNGFQGGIRKSQYIRPRYPHINPAFRLITLAGHVGSYFSRFKENPQGLLVVWIKALYRICLGIFNVRRSKS